MSVGGAADSHSACTAAAAVSFPLLASRSSLSFCSRTHFACTSQPTHTAGPAAAAAAALCLYALSHWISSSQLSPALTPLRSCAASYSLQQFRLHHTPHATTRHHTPSAIMSGVDLTEAMVKSKSRSFDLESIFSLNLSGMS